MIATTPTPSNVHRTPIQVRFSDTDALGHLNNGSFVVYAETARLTFFNAILDAPRSLILARVAVDFVQQIHFGEEVEVLSWVERIGTASVTVMHQILANGTVAGEARAVVVHFDYDRQASRPWTPAMRIALEAWQPG